MKNPFFHKSLIKKIQRTTKGQPIRTWSRARTILPLMIGHIFAVHNGHKFIPVLITSQMVGHKLGEFSETRTSGRSKSRKRK